MRAAIAFAALLSAVQPALAQEDAPHPLVDVRAARLMFSEVLFGWCGRQVAGHTFVSTTVDPSGPGWTAQDAAPRKAGAKGMGARVHTATGVIVELKPDKSSCFVQIEAPGANVLAVALRALIVRPPLNGVLAKDIKSADGHGTVYAVRAGKDGALVALAINDYADRPKLLTGVMTLESAATPTPAAGPAKP